MFDGLNRRALLRAVAALPVAASARAQEAPAVQKSFSPYDFGAKGDGETDDTAACNAASAKAREVGGALVFPPGVFAISGYIVVRDGVRQVLGQGGVIRCINTRSEAGVLLATGRGRDKPVTNCRVEGLEIDCNGDRRVNTFGIHAQNTRDCEFIGNRVRGLARGWGILLRAVRGDEPGSIGNVVADNEVVAIVRNEPGCWGIGIDADLAYTNPNRSAPEEWRARAAAATPAQVARAQTLSGNSVIGGYYGVMLSGAMDCVVRGNRLSSHVRHISIQNGSSGNLVESNDCADSLSSAIHLAYGASRNRILRNRIVTRRSVGEGLLQAYVGSSDNLFEGNSTDVSAPAAPKYHIYTGVHADRNRFVSNCLSGPCARAYLAVESGFNPASSDVTHRNHRLGADTGHFASRGMAGVVAANNVISATSAVPALYFAQISDDRGAYALKDCVIEGNVVNLPKGGIGLKLVEDSPGELSGFLLRDNKFTPRLQRDQEILPRGAAHFATISGNTGAVVR